MIEIDLEESWQEFKDYGIEDIPELKLIANIPKALNDAHFFHERSVPITGHALRRMQERQIIVEQVMALYKRDVDFQAFMTVDFNYMLVNSNCTIGVVTNEKGHIVTILGRKQIRSAIRTAEPMFSYEFPWILI